MQYSYLKSIFKGIKYAVFILFGLVLAGLPVKYPEVWNFVVGKTTIGALLIVIYDFLKHKLDIT